MSRFVDYKRIDKIFNKFAGREVLVDTTRVVKNRPYRGYVSYHHKISAQDKVIAELKAALREMGLELRVWLPNTHGDNKVQLNRVNVHIDNFSNDGRYHLGTGYQIG